MCPIAEAYVFNVDDVEERLQDEFNISPRIESVSHNTDVKGELS